MNLFGLAFPTKIAGGIAFFMLHDGNGPVVIRKRVEGSGSATEKTGTPDKIVRVQSKTCRFIVSFPLIRELERDNGTSKLVEYLF